MNLKINSHLIIPSDEIHWRFSRSSGAGGQKTNKTESRVELNFNINTSRILTPYQKHLLRKQLKGRLVNDSISVLAQEHRTQYKNRQLALVKLASLIREALKPSPKLREPTKPSISSRARRINSKKMRGKLKTNRKNTNLDNEI